LRGASLATAGNRSGRGWVQKAGRSAPAVNAALTDLERFGIIEEVTGRMLAIGDELRFLAKTQTPAIG
jgi:hypothetical protein